LIGRWCEFVPAPLPSHLLEHRLFFFDDGLEARPRKNPVDISSEPWPAFGVHLGLTVLKTHELRARRDVGEDAAAQPWEAAAQIAETLRTNSEAL